jgi:AMP-binding enzyme
LKQPFNPIRLHFGGCAASNGSIPAGNRGRRYFNKSGNLFGAAASKGRRPRILRGLDVMTVRLEHENHERPDNISDRVAAEVRTRCEIQVAVEVLARGTLPKTEFKAKRVRDERQK